MKKIQISPSILSADFSQLGNEIKKLIDAGADMIHVDVMDGHFVPNLTIGPPVIKDLKKICSIPFDVHLMISPVHNYIEAYAEAGADIITIHPEATDNLQKSIDKIKEFKKKFNDENNVPRPSHWSGWNLSPTRIEFWLDGDSRIHERLNYTIDKSGNWIKSLLSP